MLGDDQPVILHLLYHETNVPALKALETVLMDSVLPLLEGLAITSEVEQACKGVGFAILIGEITERKRISMNSFGMYKRQALALQNHAAANCKVLVIANPADKLALVLKEFAPSIPLKNITCLTRPDHNRALNQISQRLNVRAGDVKNVIIWGNHLSTQYPDVKHATVNTPIGEYLVRELINDNGWLNGGFITDFQKRSAEITRLPWDLRAITFAKGACDHIHDWVLGTPEGKWVSMGVYSDGSYNVPAGLIYSFPVTCRNGEWTIVQGLPLDEFSRKKMDSTVEELMKQHSLMVATIERHSRGQCSA
ncbi:malate dehydrogenase-like [Syzygium oleosum]|uniref:malate dehydrogenase-like n=1 Tax=Syzygium oleosum TaxID=219896 RepID=UPI0024B891F4|nr:malate dehydrogenase-like [Syzygium oleosum]